MAAGQSFWAIHRRHRTTVEAIAKDKAIDLAKLMAVSTKLKKIRDKTHFHIDTFKSPLDSKAVWRDAGLTGKGLSTAVDAGWEILSALQQSLGGPGVSLPGYDRDFVKRVALMVEEGRVTS